MPSSAMEHLPTVNVPLILIRGGKQWEGMFNGHFTRPGFAKEVWMQFVLDNKLTVEDGVVFEVLESSNELVKLKVVILRDTAAIPDELKTKWDEGKSAENAIELD